MYPLLVQCICASQASTKLVVRSCFYQTLFRYWISGGIYSSFFFFSPLKGEGFILLICLHNRLPREFPPSVYDLNTATR